MTLKIFNHVRDLLIWFVYFGYISHEAKNHFYQSCFASPFCGVNSIEDIRVDSERFLGFPEHVLYLSTSLTLSQPIGTMPTKGSDSS